MRDGVERRERTEEGRKGGRRGRGRGTRERREESSGVVWCRVNNGAGLEGLMSR